MSPVLVNPSRFGTTPAATLASLILADSPLWFIKSDETSGTTMVDSSGNARDGTYTGTPTLSATGLVSDGGTSVTYNGTTQYGTVAFDTWLAGLTAFTIIAVVKSSATSGSIVAREGTSTQVAFRLGMTGGKAFVAATTGGSEVLCTGAVTVNNNARHLLAGVWTGGQLRTLVDGTLDNTATKTGSLVTTPTNLHVGQRGNDSFWAGTLDYAALFGTALSDARIAAYAAAL